MRKRDPLDTAWRNMLARCYQPKAHRFANYGGRGITVCEEWRSSFQAFAAYIGPRPTSMHSLERIDVNGNYCPGNVRWATREDQVANRTSSRNLTFRGETKTIAEWARELGICRFTIHSRIDKLGWSADKALTWPVRHCGARSHDGKEG